MTMSVRMYSTYNHSINLSIDLFHASPYSGSENPRVVQHYMCVSDCTLSHFEVSWMYLNYIFCKCSVCQLKSQNTPPTKTLLC